MLIAIGIYGTKQANTQALPKLKQAPPDKNIVFFDDKLLANLEQESLSRLLSEPIQDNLTYYYHTKNEHHYFKKMSGDDFIMAICSRKKLDYKEHGYLFINIQHVQNRPDTVKATLDDIIINPLGFIGRDILINKVKQELSETKDNLLADVDKLLTRGEQLESLQEKTERLKDQSVVFLKRTTVLKRKMGCCGMG